MCINVTFFSLLKKLIDTFLLSITKDSDSIAEKLLSYNRANRAVAILCNHQRAPPKTFDQSMANLQSKVKVNPVQLP